jgi:branched-subunit amino acid aminotransferase/4-amino-4-deoxychorismate lyase
MRKNIILFLKKENYTIERGEYPTSKLIHANSAFLCNVTGIFPIQQIENKIMAIHPICDRLNSTFCA